MTRLVLLLLVAAAALAPATAHARECETPSAYTHIETVRVGCDQAKRIFKAYFRDGTELFNYACAQKRYPGGVTTTCRKGERKAVHYSAD